MTLYTPWVPASEPILAYHFFGDTLLRGIPIPADDAWDAAQDAAQQRQAKRLQALVDDAFSK